MKEKKGERELDGDREKERASERQRRSECGMNVNECLTVLHENTIKCNTAGTLSFFGRYNH